MNKVTAQQVEELISLHSDVVNFGNETDAVDDEWIKKAENKLGFSLSESYKWFLKKYVGGEIGTEEIYSIYGVDFEEVNGGDIVYQHLVGLRSKLVDSLKLVVSETDLGEVFFFDYLNFKDGESPVMLRIPSGEYIYYSSDFYEFLYKRILAHV